MLDNVENAMKLWRFAAAWNVVEKWVSNQNKEYFQYIVQNYKKTVVHILKQKSQIDNDYEYETYLSFALVFLRIMNRINSNNNCIGKNSDRPNLGIVGNQPNPAFRTFFVRNSRTEPNFSFFES